MEGNTLPPQNSNPLPNSTDKKAVKGFTLLKMGVLEISFVGVVLFLFFGVLNYFNILSVSSAFPEQLGWLPRQIQTPKELPYTPASLPTPILSSDQLVDKAKDLGYTILWIDPSDTTGRTVFYEKRAVLNNEGLGTNTYKNPDGKQFINQIIGTFNKFENIPNSSDKYLLLSNPTIKEAFPSIRIRVDNADTKIPTTQLIVENLSYNGDKSDLAANNIGSLNQFSETEIKNIFRIGDSVVAAINVQGVNDENGQLEALAIFIRRFGGKEQIEKEIERQL